MSSEAGLFMKTFLRWLVAIFTLASGVLHFVVPGEYARMVPTWLPAPVLLVYISGVAEILGSLGLLLKSTRKWAAWGLILLYIAIFPANVNMAIHNISPTKFHMGLWQLWLRLPLQAVLIAIAWWNTRE
jgi:uncharacterized membrane protein